MVTGFFKIILSDPGCIGLAQLCMQEPCATSRLYVFWLIPWAITCKASRMMIIMACLQFSDQPTNRRTITGLDFLQNLVNISIYIKYKFIIVCLSECLHWVWQHRYITLLAYKRIKRKRIYSSSSSSYCYYWFTRKEKQKQKP